MSNDNDKDQEYQKNMGKRLRKIRKENALSQDDVADALGICTKQYQSINTQWMLNRINYVLVIKMESAIIESDKRLSKQMWDRPCAGDHRDCGHGGRAAERGGGPCRLPGHRRAHERGLRGEPRRAHGVARYGE